MRLNRSTDYAIRMLICLAKASGAVSSSQLARTIGVSPRYLLQIGARLRDAGFVSVSFGAAGGYRLSRLPGEISLLATGRDQLAGCDYCYGRENGSVRMSIMYKRKAGVQAFKTCLRRIRNWDSKAAAGSNDL